MIAVIGILPYISLQLKAISTSYSILVQHPEVTMPALLGETATVWNDTAFWVALSLAAFTIAFGTRHLDAAEHHQGMVAASVFESLVKLLARSAPSPRSCSRTRKSSSGSARSSSASSTRKPSG